MVLFSVSLRPYGLSFPLTSGSLLHFSFSHHSPWISISVHTAGDGCPWLPHSPALDIKLSYLWLQIPKKESLISWCWPILSTQSLTRNFAETLESKYGLQGHLGHMLRAYSLALWWALHMHCLCLKVTETLEGRYYDLTLQITKQSLKEFKYFV